MGKAAPRIIRKVGLAVIKDRKVLMVRSHNNAEVFYSLGGTVEPGENDIECVRRETMEEVNAQIVPESLKFLAEFEDTAHGKENARVNMRLYIGELDREPTPSEEIVEIGWFDSSFDQRHLSPISINYIFPWLKEKGYID